MDSAFDILGTIVEFAQANMATTAAIGMSLGATFWASMFLYTLSVAMAGGAAGVSGMVISHIVAGGMIVGGLALWPFVVDSVYGTVQDVSVMIAAAEFTPLAMAQRGWDLVELTLDATLSWENLLPWNLPAVPFVNAAAFGVFLIYLLLSLTVAAALAMFWIAAVVAPIAIPFMLIPALSGIGVSGVLMVMSSMFYLIALSVILAVGSHVFEEALPAPGDPITLGTLGLTAVSAVAVWFLAWRASSMAATITRGAAGQTGMTGLVATGAAYALGGGAAASVASGAAGGGVSGGGSGGGGGGSGGGSRGGGGGSGGGSSPGGRAPTRTATVGRQTAA